MKPYRSQLRHERRNFAPVTKAGEQSFKTFFMSSTRWLDARSRRLRSGVNFINCPQDALPQRARSWATMGGWMGCFRHPFSAPSLGTYVRYCSGSEWDGYRAVLRESEPITARAQKVEWRAATPLKFLLSCSLA